MNKKFIRTIWITLLAFSYMGFTYSGAYGWALSSLGTVLILFFGFLYYRKEFQVALGIGMNWKSVLLSFILAIVFTSGAFLLIKYIAGNHDIKIYPGNYKNYYHIFFYTLNEEMILGGILIYILKVKWKIKSIQIAFGLALFYACLHFVFYKWMFLFHTNLHILTLATLFFVGALRNMLILTTKHIGYAWALHFGWMVLMFGTSHFYISNNERLSEPQLFDTYLGSYEMLGISFLLVFIYFIIIRKSLISPELISR